MEPVAFPEHKPMMSFQESVVTCLRKYADFKGRATRAEYWWWYLVTFLASSVVNTIDVLIAVFNVVVGQGYFTPLSTILGPFSTVFSLLILLPSLAVTARRLHDTGRSGWWILAWFLIGFLSLIPVSVGAIMFFVSALTDGIGWDHAWRDFGFWVPLIVGAVISFLIWIGLTIWWLIWMVKQGQRGPNRHGSDPRAWEPVVSE